MNSTSSPAAPAAAPVAERVAETRALDEQTRLQAAVRGFIADFGPQAATFMEACLHCGHCAEVCHFYQQTRDPRYTPIYKIEPFKQVYKRQVSPFAFFYRNLGITPKITLEQLQQWQDLLYDSCNMCGRCTLVCPVGIDIADLVEKARHGMFEAGLAPQDFLGVLAQKERDTGSPFGISAEKFRTMLHDIGEKYGVQMHVDEDRADVVPTVSSIDIKFYPDSMAAIARVLNHIGVKWSFRTDGFDADNVSLTAGDREGQRDVTRAIVESAEKVGAKILILPECGHSYTELRWQAANMVGHKLPFRILHISEYLAECIQDGSLKVGKAESQACTFHDPCQVSRRGGNSEAPRIVLRALGVDLHEMPFAGDTNYCCGGGGGVALIGRSKPLRQKTFEIKMKQIEATGTDQVYVSCTGCRQSLDNGGKAFPQWNKNVGSLLELVADNLLPREPAGSAAGVEQP